MKMSRRVKKVIEWVGTPNQIFEDEVINFFLEIAAIEFPASMFFEIWQLNIYDRVPEHDYKTDDTQIVFAGDYEGATDVGHYSCVHYKKMDDTVYVYDSKQLKLGDHPTRIVQHRYKSKQNKIFNAIRGDDKKQQDFISCGPFALVYAFTCLKGQQPANIKYDMNRGFGDEALYLRLYLLHVLETGKILDPPTV